MTGFDDRRSGRSGAVWAPRHWLAPALILLLLAATSLAILRAAGPPWLRLPAYAQAADRLLAGQPLYDPAIDVAGATPSTSTRHRSPSSSSFALLPDPLGTWAWIGALTACFLAGTALLPVDRSVRWTVVALAALSLPYLYGLKLGQVSPILYLCFAIGWRSLDRAVPLGISTAAGTLVKLQPALLFGWMLVTRRWAALAVGGAALLAAVAITTLLMGAQVWSDYLSLLARVSQPVTTLHNDAGRRGLRGRAVGRRRHGRPVRGDGPDRGGHPLRVAAP
jgi:hypothetical protein